MVSSITRARKYITISTYLIDVIQIIIGTMLMAIGTALFLLPSKLSTGGFSGVATIFYYFLNFNMGITIVLLNIPLLIISCFKLGIGFLSKAIIGTISLSLFIDLFTRVWSGNGRQIAFVHLWWNYIRDRNFYCIKS